MTETEGPMQTGEDLRILRESIRSLFERAGGVARSRRLRDEGGRWSNALMLELGEAGVLSAGVPESVGGLGMGLAAAGVVAEEIGRALAPEPVVASAGLAIGLLHRLCPTNPLLSRAMSGSLVLATAWQERDAMGRPSQRHCRMAGDVLTGAKSWVVAANGADRILVVAEAAGDSVLASVDPAADGVLVELRRQSDGGSLAEVTLSRAPAELLAEGPAVAEALAAAVDEATALAAAELLGVSAKALELTLQYVKTREQFDRPVGSFQAIQHRAVDMHIMQEVAEAGIREALALMESTVDPGLRARQASRAKARACTVARKITREAIQLHGAIGYTDEFDIGLFLNRALTLSAWLGDAAYHRRRWLAAGQAGETLH